MGSNVQGAGPTSKLEAGEKTFKAAQILLAVGLLYSFVGSALVFIPASWGVLSDIRCATLAAHNNRRIVPFYLRVVSPSEDP